MSAVGRGVGGAFIHAPAGKRRTTTRIGYVGLDHPHRRGYLDSLAGVEVVAACEPNPAFDLEGAAYADETRLLLERIGDGPAPRMAITYEHEPVPGYLGRVGRAFVERFLDARRGEAPTLAGIDDALRILDAAHESTAGDAWVAVPRDRARGRPPRTRHRVTGSPKR